jgi:DNA-binding phage protein
MHLRIFAKDFRKSEFFLINFLNKPTICMKPQEFFVAQLREMCPAHLNLAEELAGLLNLSLDSIYRRLRGETDISLEETLAICAHFELPLASILEQQANMVAFRTNSLGGDSESFTQYLKVIVADVMGFARLLQLLLLRISPLQNGVLEQEHFGVDRNGGSLRRRSRGSQSLGGTSTHSTSRFFRGQNP